MKSKQSQKTYSHSSFINEIEEGLSFSDYFDDSVPYEQKPPEMMRSMEEDDYPIQAKNLFAGLWEQDTSTIDKVVVPSEFVQFWLDKTGQYHETLDHVYWAKEWMKAHGIIRPPMKSIYKIMYEYGFIRVWKNRDDRRLHYQFGDRSGDTAVSPNYRQMTALKSAAIELGYDLYDDLRNRSMDLFESLMLKDALKKHTKQGKDIAIESGHNVRRRQIPVDENVDKKLFIEHMMPEDINTFKTHLAQLFAYIQKELQLKAIPKVKLVEDEKNAAKVLGKTAYYEPETQTIHLYSTNRHQKDILRSFAHECVHHWQHENEKLQTSKTGGAKEGENHDPQYAQKNPWLRQMEKQSYLLGNIMFRDWEDQKKAQDLKSQKKMVEKTMLIGKQYPPRKPDYSG